MALLSGMIESKSWSFAVFEIHLLSESVCHSSSGTKLIGDYWFEVDGEHFPAKGWSDFIAPAFLRWLREIHSLASGMPGAAALLFMDGPYEARFDDAGPGCVRVRFFERIGAPRVVKEAIVGVEDLRTALLRSVAALAAAYRGKGLDASEFERYAQALTR